MAGSVLLCTGLAFQAAPTVAHAQTTVSTAPTTPAQTKSDPEQLEPSAAEISKRYTNIPAPITFVPSSLPPSVLAGAPLLVSPYTPPRRGPLTFLGHFFNQYGITPHTIFNQYYFTNPDIGPRNGRFGLGTGIALGFDVDLQKMIGLYGGELHFEEILFRPTANAGYPSAPAYAGAVGTYFAGIDMHNDLAGGWLALMTYYQRLFHDRILLSIGRTHPRRYFYFNNCDNLLNCTDPIMQASAGVLPPPYATWGGYFTSRLVDDLSLEAGVFEANLNQYYQGGNGWRWDTRTATGYLFIGGFNFRHLMITHKYGGRYQLMGFFNSSRYTDPYTGTSHNGRAGGEFRLQQMVWRRDHARPVLQPLPESLHLFGAFGFAADPSSPFKGLAEMGLSYHGLFGRKLDTEQIKFSYTRASEHQMLYQQRMRIRSGGDPAMGSQDIMRLELSGHISLMPGVAIEPTIQYIFNPDNYYNPAAKTISTNGVVLEAALSVDMGFLTGLSHK